MASSVEVIQRLKDEWRSPRHASHFGQACPFLLTCKFSSPAMTDAIERVPNTPSSLVEFWSQAKDADLFKDTTFGQWGIRILSPDDVLIATREYKRDRPNDAIPGDLVVGTFYGDSDLLVLRCDKQCSDYGDVLVALPIDKRSDWHTVADDFANFLEQLTENKGAKFWEWGIMK